MYAHTVVMVGFCDGNGDYINRQRIMFTCMHCHAQPITHADNISIRRTYRTYTRAVIPDRRTGVSVYMPIALQHQLKTHKL